MSRLVLSDLVSNHCLKVVEEVGIGVQLRMQALDASNEISFNGRKRLGV